MEKNKFKKAWLIGWLCVCHANFVSAAENRIVLPSETRKILDEFESPESRKKMIQFLTPEVTAQIETYADLEDQEVLLWSNRQAATPAAYAGAVAGGAAAAVVERVWNKYVGNGKLQWANLDESQFDLVQLTFSEVSRDVAFPGQSLTGQCNIVFGGEDCVQNELTFDGQENVIIRPHDSIQPMVTDVINRQREYARLAARPETKQFGLAVGTAVAGMLGYKAAEWAMNKTGTATSINFDVPETNFDLQ